MKYLKLYSGKAVNPSSCYLVLYTLNWKKQGLFIEFHEEKLLNKKKQNWPRFLLGRVSLLQVYVYSFRIKTNTKISYYYLFCL